MRFHRPQHPDAEFAPDGKRQIVEVFYSFRSPHSYLALEKRPAFVKRTGIELRLRPVMPMVTRGVPLPAEKKRYIWFDSTREARRQGIPFGRVADPLVKEGYRNALALFPLAETQGKALEFSRRAMRLAFAEGHYLSDERTLRQLASDLGLDWTECCQALENEDWRAASEKNATALRELGLWGVPCICCGQVKVWGQDRMWLLEQMISDEKNSLALP
jgi:2-hydroxychromene-2-carboxylate isomerase